MKTFLTLILPALVFASTIFAEEGGRVTVDNFKRAETDTYFAKFHKDGGFGKLVHERAMAPIDRQTVIRLNRDTLYSFGVFDLDAGPLTLTLPDPGKRFMSVLLIDEDHYNPSVFYAPCIEKITKEQVGTRYVCLAVRTFANPNDPADLKAAHAAQDAIKVEQKSAGKFEIPQWDSKSLTKMREALLALTEANGEMDSARMFGRKSDVDPVMHLLGTAAGWGGNPASAAIYVGVTPEQNDGKTAYKLTFKDVPVDGFWSISVYNQAGFFVKNAKDAYTLNNVTAKPNADGSTTIHFGGDEKAINHLPIMPGWNYLVRLYRPRKEILDGTWKFPAAQPVK